MSVYAQYMVKCAGGGWLIQGRPLICHRVPTEFASSYGAHCAAVAAGWSFDVDTDEHRCPEHQTGTGHIHYFKQVGSYPVGPDGETETVKVCACGAQQTKET